MTPQDTMRLALDVLLELQPSGLTSFYTIGARNKAIEALKAALSQQDQDESDLLTIAYLDGYERGKRDALAQQGEPETWTDDGGWTFHVERQIIQTR